MALTVALLLHWSASLEAAATLIFPRLGFETASFTGIAFVNPTGLEATLTITALGPDGTPLSGGQEFRNPVELKVPPFQQRAQVLAELFGTLLPADRFGWIRVVSTVDEVTGFFLYLNLGQETINAWDGADLPGPCRKLIFPRVRWGGGYTTELNLINPGSAEVEVTSRLFRAETGQFKDGVRAIRIPAQGMARLSPVTDFGVDQAADGSFLQVAASAPVAGFEIVRLAGKDIIGLNARPATEAFQILYFPQLAVLGPWTTHLGLINLSEEAVVADVSAHNADGSLYLGPALQGSNPAPVQIPPGGAVYRNLVDIFRFTGNQTVDGWLKVETARPVLNGFVSYGVTADGSEAAVTLQPTAMTRALFGHIATSPTLNPFTGVALLNPGKISNPVRIIAFNRDTGEPYGLFDGVLRPGERIAQLISELVPALKEQTVGGGFIWVKSEHPIYMTSLFGTPQVLANIPPQPSPPSFAPGDNAPKLAVSPPIAIVQPGKTQQFAVSGPAGNPAWKVNGQAGGNSAIGTISPAGLYTAPGDLPSALPVTISAELSSQEVSLKGGATVDVLKKEVLFQGTGVVQSVAYLRGLQRLYSAELEGTVTGGEVSPAAGNTGIFQAAPGNRLRITTLNGEEIVKLLEYRAGDGKDYLLLCSRTGGRVLRLDPSRQPATPVEVAGGFDQPNSMAIDALTGNLLVADRTQVWNVTRNQLEVGLTSAQRSRRPQPEERPSALVPNLQNARGVAADACTGRIYVTEGTGRLLAVDRVTGERTEIPDGLSAPGQILGLYRKEIPCPDAFQLLLADEGTGVVNLVGPSLGLATPWVNADQSRTHDIAYLPIGSGLGTGDAQKSGILLSESAGIYSTGQVTLVRVPDLYVDQQSNVGPPQFASDFLDPHGDTFGNLPNPPDLWFVYSGTEDNLMFFTLFFTSPVSPTELAGAIEIDADRNRLTGATAWVDLLSPYASDLGVELRIDLASFVPSPEAPPEFPYFGEVSVFNAVTGQAVGTAFAFGDPQSNYLILDLELDQFDLGSQVNYAVIVGPRTGGYSDVAPNGGFLTTQPPPQ